MTFSRWKLEPGPMLLGLTLVLISAIAILPYWKNSTYVIRVHALQPGGWCKFEHAIESRNIWPGHTAFADGEGVLSCDGTKVIDEVTVMCICQ